MEVSQTGTLITAMFSQRIVTWQNRYGMCWSDDFKVRNHLRKILNKKSC